MFQGLAEVFLLTNNELMGEALTPKTTLTSRKGYKTPIESGQLVWCVLMKRSSRAWKKKGKQRWKWRKKKMRRRKHAQKMRKR
jgi:large subunit ribosomal protein L41e